MNAAAIPDLLPMLAELTELATRQIEKLGMVFGYLPRKHPFLMSMQSLPVDEPTDNTESPNGEDALDSPSHFHSSNAELQDSLASQDAFDEMYRSLLDQVHEAWSGSLRARSANKIKATLAAFEQYVTVSSSGRGYIASLRSLSSGLESITNDLLIYMTR
jgi:hypothetical protein